MFLRGTRCIFVVGFFLLLFLEERFVRVRQSNAFPDGRETICLCSLEMHCNCCTLNVVHNVQLTFTMSLYFLMNSWLLTFTPHFEMEDPYTFLNTFFWWKRINCYTLLYRSCLYSEFDHTAMPYNNISEQTIIRCFCERTGMRCSRDRMQLVPIANIVFFLATVVRCTRYNLMGRNLLLDCVRSDFAIVFRHRPPIRLTRYIAEIQYCWICEDT